MLRGQDGRHKRQLGPVLRSSELARVWLRTCTSHEHDCYPDESCHRKNTTYPTRLIDLWAQWDDEVIDLKQKETEKLGKEKLGKE